MIKVYGFRVPLKGTIRVPLRDLSGLEFGAWDFRA